MFNIIVPEVLMDAFDQFLGESEHGDMVEWMSGPLYEVVEASRGDELAKEIVAEFQKWLVAKAAQTVVGKSDDENEVEE